MTNKYKKEYPEGISQYFWDTFVVPRTKEFYGNKCSICNAKDNLDVHHNKYTGEITIKDLKVLCRSCHKKEHNKE